MSAEKKYKQCLLGQNGRQTTVWVELRGAKAGVDVEVPKLRGFWRVITVYDGVVLSESKLTEHQRLNRGSLPSVERTGK